MGASCRRERRISAHWSTDTGGDRLVIRRGIREVVGLISAGRGRDACRGRPRTESGSHKSEGRIAAGRSTCDRRGRLVVRRGSRKSERPISAGQGNGARGARSDTRRGSRRCSDTDGSRPVTNGGSRKGEKCTIAGQFTCFRGGRPNTKRGSHKDEGLISAGRGSYDRGARSNTRRGRARKLPWHAGCLGDGVARDMGSRVVVSNAHRRCDLQRRELGHRDHGKRCSGLAHGVEVARSATGPSRIAVAAAEDCTAVAIAVVNMRDKRRGRRKPPHERGCVA
jgi:hypothetical protein